MPYLHFTDPGLLRERERCTQAVIRYNEGAIPDKNISINQRGEWFSQILEPRKRPQTDQKEHHGPQGEIGDYSIVDTPFRCDYGYHIHLGKEVVISAECYLQDGGGIHIGDRVIIGTRTQLLTMTASVDANVRGGSQGRCKAGRILIDDDVFIGAGVIVLPYVTIGKGAVVGAGSVVTRVR
jgi:acetyltransferase-like isoleucine patch superfamily enzyme